MDVTGQEERFRQMFAEEAEGRLATLSELLLELEAADGDAELLASVFREAHTLKGAAAVVGLDEVGRVAHAMEEILDGLRRGERATTSSLVDALLRAVDGMRELIPAVLGGDDRAAEADRLVAALQQAAAGGDAPQPPEPPEPAPAAGRAPEPAPAAGRPAEAVAAPVVAARGGETIRVPVERLDELVRLVGEAAAAYLRVGRLLAGPGGGRPAGDRRAGPTLSATSREIR